MIDLSIIIVTYNSEKDIRPCLNSIVETKGDLAIELFVVDNNSQDNTVAVVRNEYPAVRLIANDTNAGFPGANNQAIRKTNARYILLLNPDTIVRPNALQEMVKFMAENPEYGVCGPRLVDENGHEIPYLRRLSFWNYCVSILGAGCLFGKYLPIRQIDYISGAALMFRRELIDKVGFLEEKLFWCEDMDFCQRSLSKGYHVGFVQKAFIVHLVGRSGSFNLPLMLEKQYSSKIAYLVKHKKPLETRMIILLFMAEVAARWLKWGFYSAWKSSEVGNIRVKTFARLFREIPGLYRNLKHSQ